MRISVLGKASAILLLVMMVSDPLDLAFVSLAHIGWRRIRTDSKSNSSNWDKTTKTMGNIFLKVVYLLFEILLFFIWIMNFTSFHVKKMPHLLDYLSLISSQCNNRKGLTEKTPHSLCTIWWNIWDETQFRDGSMYNCRISRLKTQGWMD